MKTLVYGSKRLILSVIAITMFMTVLDSNIVNIALPKLMRVFGVGFSTIQWVVLSYLMTVTTLMLVAGRLVDMLDKRRMFLAGLAIFVIASMMCGVKVNIWWLITWRLIQGIGTAMIVAAGPAILADAFPANQRGKAFGVIGPAVSIGVVTGPALGGIIVEKFGWNWIFFVNIPFGLVALALAARVLPAPHRSPRIPFDLPGAVTMGLSLLGFLLALTFGQNVGWFSPGVSVLLLVSMIFFVLFIRRELRTEHPLLHLFLFQNAVFTVNLISSFLTFIITAGILIIMPFYLQNLNWSFILTKHDSFGSDDLQKNSVWKKVKVNLRPLIFWGLHIYVVRPEKANSNC